jgi:hypothetical protein
MISRHYTCDIKECLVYVDSLLAAGYTLMHTQFTSTPTFSPPSFFQQLTSSLPAKYVSDLLLTWRFFKKIKK